MRSLVLGAGLLLMAISHTVMSQGASNLTVDKGQKEWLEQLSRFEREAYAFAAVTAIGVNSPIGRWVLLRKGKDLCAARFTTFHRAHPNEKSIKNYQESFFADYDWVYQFDGSGKFNNPNAQPGHSEADKRPNLWRFPRGTNRIQCGPLKADWWYPNGISLIPEDFHPDTANRSNGIEIALTGWKDINQVDAHHPKLVWHHYDPVRDVSQIHENAVIIPVEQLPGGAGK